MENPAARMGCGVFLLDIEDATKKDGPASPRSGEMRGRPTYRTTSEIVN